MILDKLASGHSYRKLVEEYRLSATTIQRWKKSIERKKYERKPAKIDNEALMADVQAYPDEIAMNGQDALTVATELLP
ncbi:Uncharacterised protein [Suttonella indologenes]|uniref:Transposase Synechocystis PCC 6803 domain-containing protein n=2 Tax=Suttonella indologenes TaxID=13276 RepID=A0A380MYE1_9GAMM|nr:Uncharacterised protein [Suttonella indologenes]